MTSKEKTTKENDKQGKDNKRETTTEPAKPTLRRFAFPRDFFI